MKATKVQLKEMETQARELMANAGLGDWTFRWGRRLRVSGLCWFDDKVIEVSRWVASDPIPGLFREVVVHEIAHAVLDKVEHDDEWAELVRMMGGEPHVDVRGHGSNGPTSRWKTTCPCCGTVGYLRRRPRPGLAYVCIRCPHNPVVQIHDMASR